MTNKNSSRKPEWWRTVLGEYPTGVALITSTDSHDEPIAMVVGTFTAVSEDPAMVGFLPAVTSSTFPKMRDKGTFSVSILGSKHEHLCRAFGSADPNRFTLASWSRSQHGHLRVDDALAWFDCDLSDVYSAGDHFVALATVNDYGVGSGAGGLPLLYLRGGYGTFAIPTEHLDVADLSAKLRTGDRLRKLMSNLAKDCGTGVLLGALTGDSVMVLAQEGQGQNKRDDSEYGLSFPFAAPMASALVAWAPDERVKYWLEGARHLIGSVDRAGFARTLELARARGYAVSAGPTMLERFDQVITRDFERDELVSLWKSMQQEQEHAVAQELISSIQVPIFDEQGFPAMEIVVTNPPVHDAEEFNRLLSITFDAARTATELIGGIPNQEWLQAVNFGRN